MIASLISAARQRSEKLDESVDLFQDHFNNPGTNVSKCANCLRNTVLAELVSPGEIRAYGDPNCSGERRSNPGAPTRQTGR